MKSQQRGTFITRVFSTLILSSTVAIAADLNPSAGPASTPSYTLQDICNRLGSGEEGTKQNFTEPASGPADSADCTLNEVMEKAPKKDTANGVQPDDVPKGKTYWGLTDGNWGIKTGTGTETGAGGGVKCSTGTDRFSDNNDGTVTDTCTNLIWLKKANCYGKKNWNNAKVSASSLQNGSCGLSDGSVAGNWRLPSMNELQSLIDRSRFNPSLPSGHPFSGVQPGYYWAATTYANDTSYAWSVYLTYGRVNANGKSNTYYVWPVRSRH